MEKITPYVVQLPTTGTDSDLDVEANTSPEQIPCASSSKGKGKGIEHTSLISNSSRSSLSYWPSDSSWPSEAESEAACTDRESIVSINSGGQRSRNNSRFSDDASEMMVKSPTTSPKSIFAYSRNRVVRFGEVVRNE